MQSRWAVIRSFRKQLKDILLVQHNLHQENSKYKWRKIGYNSDPQTKANLQTHDFDDFTDIPKYLERIKNHGKDKKPKSK